MNLRFHWMLPKGGEVSVGAPQTPREAAEYRSRSTLPGSPAARPDLEGWAHFARRAEEAGIESVLIAFNRYEPDPLLVACALGRATARLKFIAAYRSGLMQPAMFVQQINTLSCLIDGRIALNLVAGSSKAEQHGYGDYLDHDDRYARAEEFLAICHRLWRAEGAVDFDGKHHRVEQAKILTPFVAEGRSAPEIYVSGHSEGAERLARAQGSCLLRVADSVEALSPWVTRVRGHGVEVCLRVGVLCRPTRDEAIRAAESLLPEREALAGEQRAIIKDDSQMHREAPGAHGASDPWLSRSLWTGLVPFYKNPVWTTLLGTPEEIAATLLEYKKIGVTQFILSGWPELDEVITFGREVLPLVRRAEQGREGAPARVP